MSRNPGSSINHRWTTDAQAHGYSKRNGAVPIGAAEKWTAHEKKPAKGTLRGFGRLKPRRTLLQSLAKGNSN
jgi:hypothetical protein